MSHQAARGRRGNRVAPVDARRELSEHDDPSDSQYDPFDQTVAPEVLVINPLVRGETRESSTDPREGANQGGSWNGSRPSSSHRNAARSPTRRHDFQEKWADILHVLNAFHKERAFEARDKWLQMVRERRVREAGRIKGEAEPSTIAAEFGMYFFQGIFDHDKHVLVQRVDTVLDKISLLCSPSKIDPHIGDELQKGGGDYRYLSHAYEWRSFFSEARNWIAHDETFAPFADNQVIDERSRAIQLAQTLLYIRDHLGPTASWKHAAGESGTDYDVEACKACDESVESITSSSYHLLDFESDEGVGLLHLAAASGCLELFYGLLRIGAVIEPTVHHKEPAADYFSQGTGSDAAFDTRANRKLERLTRFLYHFADGAFREVGRLNEEVGADAQDSKRTTNGSVVPDDSDAPRVFSRTGTPKGFETSLKTLRGHLNALQLFMPHGSFENSQPSSAACDVLEISVDGQSRPPPGVQWPKHKQKSKIDIGNITGRLHERKARKSQHEKARGDLARRYADSLTPNNKRVPTRLRREFERDALNRYRMRLQFASDSEQLFDDVIETDMYGRTPLHCAIQYDQMQFVNFVLDTSTDMGLFHRLVRIPVVSPFKARDEGVHRAFNLLGDEFELIETPFEEGDQAPIPDWRPLHGPLSATSRRPNPDYDIVEQNLRDRYLQKVLLATTNEGETPLHFAARYDRHGIIFMLLQAISEDVILFESEHHALHRASVVGAAKTLSPRISKMPINANAETGALPEHVKASTLKLRSRKGSLVERLRASRTLDTLKCAKSQSICPEGRSPKDDNLDWLKSDVEDLEVHSKVSSLVLADVVSNCCPCRSVKPFAECCGRSSRDKWSQARANAEGRRTITPLIGRAMQLAPHDDDGEFDYKGLLHRPLTLMQRIFRDMRDRNGMTALHTACKMDRDDSATVLLGLGSDPGTRDIDNTCAMYHMILNIPSVAVYALDQFHLIDRSNRTESLFLSFLMPQEPEDELILRKHQYDQDRKRNDQIQKSRGGGVGELHHSKPSHREKPKWTWHPISREEYRYRFWDYARAGNAHTLTLSEVLGKTLEDYVEEDKNAFQTRERRPLLDMVVERNRMGCANTLVLEAIVSVHWKKFCKKDFRSSALWYCMFLLCWTFVAYMMVYGARHTAESWIESPTALARLTVEAIALILLLLYVRIEYREFRAIAKFSKGVRELEIEDLYDDMAAMSETWPDYFYLWRLWQDIEGAGGGWDAYISDTWNQFDLIAYALLFSSEILNVAAFCLRSSDASWYQVRVLLVGIIFAYLKIFKFARSSKDIGPFIIMLGGMTRDCLLFLFLFVCTWVPFSLSFFVLFHDNDQPALYNSFGTFGRSLLSGFQMMMVDFDYSELRDHDENTGAILWIVWVFLSALVFLNLFIAMMSNTYQLVQDDCNRIAVMQRASTVVSMMRTRSREERRKERLQVLASLDENGCGRERYLSKFFDDPDDEGDDHERNIRLEILSSVNSARSAISRLEGKASEADAKERKNRKIVKLLAHNVDKLADRVDGNNRP